ncbi:response regulator transcription factor [Lampropedia aestuarii]|uniref:Response regulator transcription factor n=1 Tax=Lampropedia aestuarii TaxID=2562762 RepID=A0A4S5BN19_9BURK|nr:response regulator transcription factor [Lampropedia aestuarii]MDH5858484.1 response regulator transcription factor [Lampropedia aestuarii]THJ34037.1 response regulator transcription factor [Lampropedia aestuarii]
MRIAVLDDDPLVQELERAAIEQLGHSCYTYSDGVSLLKDLRRQTFDLLIVDWHLPDMDGPRVVESVRKSIGSNIPILFVTRRGTEEDVVEGLSCGADDFMTKPVRIGELTARLNALLRRAYPATQTGNLEFGIYRFNTDKRSLEVRGVPVEMKTREFNLALFMFQNVGRLLSRDHVREMVWGQLYQVPSRSLDTHVSRLRTKLELTPENGYVVNAVYGVGYRLESSGLEFPEVN